MQAFVNEMRGRLYGLVGDALDAVQHNLSKDKDGHLAYRLLTDLGVWFRPSRKGKLSRQIRHQKRKTREWRSWLPHIRGWRWKRDWLTVGRFPM
jgi:hypothetical protein